MQTITSTRTQQIPDFGTALCIDELIRIAQAAGSHFFDPASRRFFRSRIADDTWACLEGWVFITSEQFETFTPSYRREARKYTIRILTVQNGDLTIDEPEGHSDGFQKYASLSQARTGVKRLIKAGMLTTKQHTPATIEAVR